MAEVGEGRMVAGAEGEDEDEDDELGSFLLIISSTDHILGLGAEFCFASLLTDGATVLVHCTEAGISTRRGEGTALTTRYLSVEALDRWCPPGEGGGVIGTKAGLDETLLPLIVWCLWAT